MYLENSVKAALGLIGHTDPSLALVQERVKATGYKGYVSGDFKELVAKKRTRKPKAVKEEES